MKPPCNARVLVIEDDDSIRATLSDILEFNGFKVLHAANGLDGVEVAQHATPDIILTDIAMPGLDGFGVIKALHADDATRPIPIIIISASVEPERMRQGMDLGAEDFIIKPFTEDQVLRSIRARLEKKALLDELDAFAHTVAHDLKNPIMAVSLRGQLMRMTLDSADKATLEKHLDELERAAGRLNTIVDELLLLAGVQRQNVPLVRVEMEPVVQESLGRVEHMVRQSKAQIQQAPSWPAVLGHEPWIAEIWTNYLSNAMKYGGTPPIVRLGSQILPDRGCVRFWVEDNGAGLNAHQQSELFRAFARNRVTRIKGHGLGLSIVRRITEKLGGAAGVESEQGKGSRFWFELPSSGDPD